MKPTTTAISALEVVNDLTPKLNAVEKHIEQMVKAVLDASSVPNQIERYSKLQVEFQLELTMIRMNLSHLLKRYRHELEAVMNDNRQDVLFTLNTYEAMAVESAKQLYDRVQRIQQG